MTSSVWRPGKGSMRRQNEGVAREDSLTTRLTLETYQPPAPPKSATMPWWAAAVGAGLVSAIGGWALVAALVLISQLAQTGVVLGSGLRLATQMWLLGQGGILEISGVRITLVPLGLTAIIAVLLYGTSGYAAHQAVLSSGDDAKLGLAVAKVTGVVAASYAVTVTIASFLVDGSDLRAAAGAMVLSLVMGFFGARKSAKWNLAQSWPVWARAVPRAVGAGVLTALLGGVVVVAAGLISHREQIIAMTDGLNPGWTGSIVLAILQLFFIINIIVWCVSWSYGPGFTLGDGSVVSLMGSQVGLLPAFPLTAALPSGDFSWADLGWLAVPVLSGAVAAAVVLRERPRARFDETALVGGLSGVLAGAAIAGLAVATRGSLGTERLAGMGPFLLPLLLIACSIMGLGGMVTGFIVGLIRRPAKSADPLWWSRWGKEPGTPGQPDTAAGQSGEVSGQPAGESGHPGEDTAPTQLLSRTPADVRRASGWLAPVLEPKEVPAETVTEKIPNPSGSDTTTVISTPEKITVDEQPPIDFHADDC